MNFVQEIPVMVWLTSIPDVIIDTTEKIQAVFIDNYTGKTIYNELLYPDNNGIVTIYDVKQILLSSMKQAVAKKLISRNFKFSAIANQTISFNFNCFYTDCFLDGNPLTFIHGSFLTRCTTKITTADSKEMLSMYKCFDESLISVKFTLNAGTQQYTGSLLTLLPKIGNRILTFDVSLSELLKITPTTLRILSYDVTWSSMRGYGGTVHYIVDYNTPKLTATFKYANLFGLYEYLNIYGNDDLKKKYEKSIAKINGFENVYQTKLQANHVVSTSIVRQSLRDVMEDFFASEDVWRVEDNIDVEQVIVEEITDETSDAYEALDSYKFTWRKCSPNHRKELYTQVFDDTFERNFE